MPSGPHLVVGGRVLLPQFRESLGKPMPGKSEKPGNTFANWVQSRASGKLRNGDVVNIKGLRILTIKTRRQKIMKEIVFHEVKQ